MIGVVVIKNSADFILNIFDVPFWNANKSDRILQPNSANQSASPE
jgi:hypothetical protein